MTLFQQKVFKIILIIGIQTALALNIEAPQEIEGLVLEYSKEAGAETNDAILRVSIVKNENCKAFSLKLINKTSKKTIEETERCITKMPNAVLQESIFELFGRAPKTETGLSGNAKTIFIGAGFAVAGILLYYSKPPKPVYGYNTNQISGASK